MSPFVDFFRHDVSAKTHGESAVFALLLVCFACPLWKRVGLVSSLGLSLLSLSCFLRSLCGEVVMNVLGSVVGEEPLEFSLFLPLLPSIACCVLCGANQLGI